MGHASQTVRNTLQRAIAPYLLFSVGTGHCLKEQKTLQLIYFGHMKSYYYVQQMGTMEPIVHTGFSLTF